MEVKSLRKRWIITGVKRYVLLSLSSQAVVWDTMTIYLVSSHPASSPLVIQSKLHTWLLCRLKALFSTIHNLRKGRPIALLYAIYVRSERKRRSPSCGRDVLSFLGPRT